jgi:D-alanine-D-alanine ligase
MRILVLYNVAQMVRKGSAADLSCEVEIEIIAPMIEDILRAAGHKVERRETTYGIWEQLRGAREDFDLVFNLAEAFGGTNSYEPLVPAMLEALQIPFTGASALSMMLTLDKGATKRVAQSIGIRTPGFAIAYDDLPPAVSDLRMPLIVKPLREEASIGITPNSIVLDLEELPARVAELHRLYRQPALIEEFIDGREISIGAIGNGRDLRILPFLEFLFAEGASPRERIRSYEYKWGGKKEVMVPAMIDDVLAAQLRSWTAKLFEACECRDYARMDYRLNDDGAYLLEVNYNPGIGPNTHGLNNTITMMASFEGGSFETLVLEIIETAAARERLATATGTGL